MAPITLRSYAVLAVTLFAMLSMFLFYQHELHSIRSDNAGLNLSYKKLKKIGKIITKTVQHYVHIPDIEEIRNGSKTSQLMFEDDDDDDGIGYPADDASQNNFTNHHIVTSPVQGTYSMKSSIF